METKVRAVKMTYDVANEEWARTTLRVSFSRAPFASGGMRDCYRAFEHCADGDVFEMVAKVFKPECDAADHEYFDEAVTQMIAESYAQDFNRKSETKIGFLPVSVLQLQDGSLGGSKLCALEPFLPGEYIKHNDNGGAVHTDEALPQAFSHFTYESTGGMLVCCDIQGRASSNDSLCSTLLHADGMACWTNTSDGWSAWNNFAGVGDSYTDPQIHSMDGEGFGSGNLGVEGVERWKRTHACNTLCTAVGLQSLIPGETDAMLAQRLQEGERLNREPPSAAEPTKSAADGNQHTNEETDSMLARRLQEEERRGASRSGARLAERLPDRRRLSSSSSSSSDDSTEHYFRRMMARQKAGGNMGSGRGAMSSVRYQKSLQDAMRMLQFRER